MFVHTICTLQDGVLKEVNNTKLSLIADNGRHVESVFTKSDNIIVGDEIESDGHLTWNMDKTESVHFRSGPV